MKLYAIKDISTGKLVTGITSPSHKFWEHRKRCEKALQQYILNTQYVRPYSKKPNTKYVMDNYKVIAFELREV